MSKSKLDERIASHEARLQQLKTQRQRINARNKALESRRDRKADTRRKILIGAIVLAKIDQGEFDQALLHRWLDAALTRPADRALFDLPGGTRDPSSEPADRASDYEPGGR